MPRFQTFNLDWSPASPRKIDRQAYDCGYCGVRVGSSEGWAASRLLAHVYICPNCSYPTFIGPNGQRAPGPLAGRTVDHVPDDVGHLYDEARECVAVSAYTAAVLLCRKLLMHVAVEKSAPENAKFVVYVNWLADNHWVPPNARAWVDHIRDKGNEANHEITLVAQQDAVDLLTFVEALLRYVYELPGSLPSTTTGSGEPTGPTYY